MTHAAWFVSLQRGDGPPITTREEDQWPQTKQAEATIGCLLCRDSGLCGPAGPMAQKPRARATLVPAGSDSSSTVTSLQSSTTDTSVCSQLPCDTVSIRSGNNPALRLRAAGHLGGFSGLGWVHCLKPIPPSLRCPIPQHSARQGHQPQDQLAELQGCPGTTSLLQEHQVLEESQEEGPAWGTAARVRSQIWREAPHANGDPRSAPVPQAPALLCSPWGAGNPAQCSTGGHRPHTFPSLVLFNLFVQVQGQQTLSLLHPCCPGPHSLMLSQSSQLRRNE